MTRHLLDIKKKMAIVSLLLALMMTVLDGTLVNMALPVVTTQFGVTPSDSIWIVTVYQLVITTLLLPLSSAGDLYSYKKTFISGVVIFTVSSLLCAVSNSFLSIVLSRAFQGLGAACVMGVNIAITRLIYPREIIGRGLALNAMVIAVTTAVGPTLAGAILSVATWHWLFIINIPIGILVLLLSAKYLPDNKIEKVKNKFDFVGAVQNILVFGMIFLALNSFTKSYKLVVSSAVLICGITLGYFYIKRQSRMQAPMFPLDLLKVRLYSLSIFTSVCSFIAQSLVLISLPFLFLDCFGFSEITTGLLLTPWPLATMIVSPFAARFVERHNPGIVAALGMGTFALGVISILFYQPGISSEFDIACRLAVCGLGYGLYQTPNNVVMVMATPVSRAGGAGGLQSTARLVGQTLGAIMVTFIFAMSSKVMSGARASLYCAIGIAMLAGVLSLVRSKHITIPDRK